MNQTAWSLNGVWQVVTDDELQGRALHWERHSALLNRPDVRQVSIPVSYTHLDVYKRQVLRQASMALPMADE